MHDKGKKKTVQEHNYGMDADQTQYLCSFHLVKQIQPGGNADYQAPQKKKNWI